LIPITSSIYFHRSFGYEKINSLRTENQVIAINFNLHFKTTSKYTPLPAAFWTAFLNNSKRQRSRFAVLRT
jgi:hypothetical protein